MRRIIYALSEIRQGQLSDMRASPTRMQEVREMFTFLDHQLNGVSPMNSNERLAEVMISGDFTYAIQEWIQRKMWASYQEQTFGFEPLVTPDTLPNYLPVTRYLDQAGVDDLEYMGQKEPARPGSVDDVVKRQWQVYLWGKQYDFAHEALVNDDLGYFDDMTTKMGRAARRTLEKFVSRLYSNATTIARLVALGALYATTGRLTTARISSTRMAFNQRVNARGERIMSPMTTIVHHTGLVDTVATIQNSTLVPENANNAVNVVKGTFRAIEDPYLTGTAPNLPWYAFASSIKTFVLARRAGMPGPMILRKRSDVESITSLLGAGAGVAPIWGDFNSGNIVVKVVDIWGTYTDSTEGNLVDYHGAFYSDGTTP